MRARALSVSVIAVLSAVFLVSAVAPAFADGRDDDRRGKSHKSQSDRDRDDERRGKDRGWHNPIRELFRLATEYRVALNERMADFQKQIDSLRDEMRRMAGTNGGSGTRLAVYDAAGQKIGDVIGTHNATPVVGLSAEGKSFGLRVYPSRLVGGTVFFTEAGCAGTPYLQPEFTDFTEPASAIALAGLGPSVSGVNYSVVYASTPHVAPTPVPVRSRFAIPSDAGTEWCKPMPTFADGSPRFSVSAVPALPVLDLSAYSRPYIVK
jgi:hypothetical protein